MSKYIISIDQSTSSTKAILFDENADMVLRKDCEHKQYVDERGFVEHSPNEIYKNILISVKKVIDESGVSKKDIICAALSNQRETSIVWDRNSGEPIYNAVVWQCQRGMDICKSIGKSENNKKLIKDRTGLTLSPYFSAAKIAWVLENAEKAKTNDVVCSTIDSWLLYKLTKEKNIKTDYSNASRTQLFNIMDLKWDKEIVGLFGIKTSMLPDVCDSNSIFGHTDFEGILDKEIPIHSVMGDSHSALYAQGCLEKGMVKSTYGTGSSVMMNIGDTPFLSEKLVTSLAWGIDGKANYVLEGNINYTGAVIKWLTDDLKLISSSKEAGMLAKSAKENDSLYIVPAFTGLAAPYWDSDAKAVITGIDRNTGKAEFVAACEKSIAYQIADIVFLMNKCLNIKIESLKVDGGPTKDAFLMQFQADIIDSKVCVARIEELSAMGVAYMAGIASGLYDKNEIFKRAFEKEYTPSMNEEKRKSLYGGWKNAVSIVLKK